jgi:nickel/cobalt exporter
MSGEILVLAGTAASIGLVHTLIGPDHYLPFIVMSRARSWSLGKTLWISLLCGLGHVLSSIALGFVGIALGLAVFRLESIESLRGEAAAWLLMAFGLAYFVWGLHRALKKKPHTHAHLHEGGARHEHLHSHESGHAHAHVEEGKRSLTPWILFTVFVFGPCEPLIPLIMYPAAKHSTSGVVIVAAVFSAVTIATMLGVIAAASWGVSFIRLGVLEKYAHAMAGALIVASGLGVRLLGL